MKGSTIKTPNARLPSPCFNNTHPLPRVHSLTVLGLPFVPSLFHVNLSVLTTAMGDLYPHIDPSHERDFPLSPRPGFSHSSERPPTLSQLGKNRADMRIDFNRDHLSYLEAAASSSLAASTNGESSSSLPGNSQNTAQPPGQTRRSRKDKMRIELSADQPPTTQGRQRTRVFVACLQWCAPPPTSLKSSFFNLP